MQMYDGKGQDLLMERLWQTGAIQHVLLPDSIICHRIYVTAVKQWIHDTLLAAPSKA
jgi:hypothetical protein